MTVPGSVIYLRSLADTPGHVVFSILAGSVAPPQSLPGFGPAHPSVTWLGTDPHLSEGGINILGRMGTRQWFLN